MDTEELIENFEFLGDWEERYRYIIELGKKLAPLEENERIEDNIVEAARAKSGWSEMPMKQTSCGFAPTAMPSLSKDFSRSCSLPMTTAQARTFSLLMPRTSSIASAWTNTLAQAARMDFTPSFKKFALSRTTPKLAP